MSRREVTGGGDDDRPRRLGTAPGKAVPRLKRTFHLPPEDVYILDDIQAAEHRRTGKKPHLSQLVSEAIRLLSERHRRNAR